MTPAMIKLKHNEAALATALETMSDKVESLIVRVPAIGNQLRKTDQKVANEALYERELQAKLKVVYKNLLDLKGDVRDLLDPRVMIQRMLFLTPHLLS